MIRTMSAGAPRYADLRWIDNRWHCQGRPIHAGCRMELKMDDGSWTPVRIESQNNGTKLIVCLHTVYGPSLDGPLKSLHRLRWPQETKR